MKVSLRILITAVVSGFIFNGPAPAAPCSRAAGSPCRTIRDTAEQIVHLLKDSPLQTKQWGQKRLRDAWYVILPHVDTCEMAMRSLPEHYLLEMTGAQKQEFTDLYARLLMQAYSLVLGRYSKNAEFRLVYDEETIEGSHARVKSRLITSKAEYRITYHLRRERKKWLITDVSYDAVSQVENYRAQIDRIGKKFSYDYEDLRSRINARLESGLKHLPAPQVKMRLWGICQRP